MDRRIFARPNGALADRRIRTRRRDSILPVPPSPERGRSQDRRPLPKIAHLISQDDDRSGVGIEQRRKAASNRLYFLSAVGNIPARLDLGIAGEASSLFSPVACAPTDVEDAFSGNGRIAD